MIKTDDKNMRRLRKICPEIEKVEGWNDALLSKEKYELHHRKEDEGYTHLQLKEMGEYRNLSPDKLIFMSETKHKQHHLEGSKHHRYRHDISEESVLELRHKGMTYRQIADALGCGVDAVIRRLRRQHT